MTRGLRIALAVVTIMLLLLMLWLLTRVPAGSPNVGRAPPADTPIPPLPTPTNVPSGWQVYALPSGVFYHWTMAYPPSWTVRAERSGGGYSYTFTAQGTSQFVVVEEQDGLDSYLTKQVCTMYGDVHVTYANLSMLYSLDSDGTVRVYTFVAAASGAAGPSVMYQLRSSATDPPETRALYDTIFATFRPEYTTPACV
jgi:hypothetical protein